MKRTISCILAVILLTLPLNVVVYADQDIVERVKNELVAKGVDLNGPCGAFQITKRVAWRMQGYFLLKKPAGNNCEGYATDIVVRNDGQGFDILGDGGGANQPAWNMSDIFPAERMAAPFDPEPDIPVVIITPPVTPPSPSLEPGWCLTNNGLIQLPCSAYNFIDGIKQDLKKHDEKADKFYAAVESEWKKFGVFVSKYVLPAIGGILGGKLIFGSN